MPAKKGMSGKAMGIGAGLVAAAAIGAYFLGGKDGAKNRKAVKGWMLKAKGEVLEKLENLESVSQEAYDKAVKEVTARYQTMKQVDPKEFAALMVEMKKYWNMMKRGAKKPSGTKSTKSSSAKKSAK
jgi:hypothetical protein